VLHGCRIEIAEDEPVTAFDLTLAVEAAQGEVVGPFNTVERGLAEAFSRGTVHAAILDVHLADGEITHLALRLFEHGAAVVFHTASPIPSEITRRHGSVFVLHKPIVSNAVITHLAKRLKI
jgi:hypothetical protein